MVPADTGVVSFYADFVDETRKLLPLVDPDDGFLLTKAILYARDFADQDGAVFKIRQLRFNMNDAVSVGITGIGGYGRVLLDLLLEQQNKGNIRLKAAVVAFREQDAEHLTHLESLSLNTEVFASLDELVASNVDLNLMVLPVGIPAHRELVEKSLAAGWNVLVEKPLAGSMEDAAAIARAEECAVGFVAVGFQDMYSGCVQSIKQRILEGTIGEVQNVRAIGVWGRPKEYYQRNLWAGKLHFNGQPVYDSPINNALAHYLNAALFFAGTEREMPAVPQSVEGEFLRAHDIESFDTAHAVWQTDSGVPVCGVFTHASTENIHPSVRAVGSEGTIVWDISGKWTLTRIGEVPEEHAVPEPMVVRKDMIQAVLKKVRDPSVPVFGAAAAMAQVKAVALSHRSAEIRPFSDGKVHLLEKTDEHGETTHWLDVLGLSDACRHIFEESWEDYRPILTERFT